MEENKTRLQLEVEKIQAQLARVIVEEVENGVKATPCTAGVYFEDVLLMTGTKPFATEMSKLVEYSDDREIRLKQLDGMLGKCEMVSAGYAETLFIGCNPNKEEFAARVKDLREQAERVKKVHNHIMDFNYNDIMGCSKLQTPVLTQQQYAYLNQN